MATPNLSLLSYDNDRQPRLLTAPTKHFIVNNAYKLIIPHYSGGYNSTSLRKSGVLTVYTPFSPSIVLNQNNQYVLSIVNGYTVLDNSLPTPLVTSCKFLYSSGGYNFYYYYSDKYGLPVYMKWQQTNCDLNNPIRESRYCGDCASCDPTSQSGSCLLNNGTNVGFTLTCVTVNGQIASGVKIAANLQPNVPPQSFKLYDPFGGPSGTGI